MPLIHIICCFRYSRERYLCSYLSNARVALRSKVDDMVHSAPVQNAADNSHNAIVFALDTHSRTPPKTIDNDFAGCFISPL